jgi:hypothetical protein
MVKMRLAWPICSFKFDKSLPIAYAIRPFSRLAPFVLRCDQTPWIGCLRLESQAPGLSAVTPAVSRLPSASSWASVVDIPWTTSPLMSRLMWPVP